eukprot:418594_1
MPLPKSENSDDVVVDEISQQQAVEIRCLLKIERQKSANLQLEVAELRQRAADITQAAEAEEEAIVNRMVIRLEEIKKEKESLALQVEREEEMLTNTLQMKLSVVRTEKERVEAQLEAEVRGLEESRERMKKQLENAEKEKAALEFRLEHDVDSVYEKLQMTIERLHHSEKFVNSKRAVFVDDELQLLENILEQIEALRELGTKSRAHSLLPTKQ